MIRMKKISETTNLRVFTDMGDYFGDVEDAIIINNKVDRWKIRATKESFLSKAISGAKGVYVPHHLVQAIGNIMIVSKAAAPTYSAEETKE